LLRRRGKLGNPNGVDNLRRAGQGGMVLRADVNGQRSGLGEGFGTGDRGHPVGRTHVAAELTARGI
jgi:hypothetical protein